MYSKNEMTQVTSHILMIRPASFGFNVETAANNAFQHKPGDENYSLVAAEATKEFDKFSQLLLHEGIDVTVLNDS
ncbi:MAG: arginine deiminase-related protein, partial [Saprospiraceae bacterium]